MAKKKKEKIIYYDDNSTVSDMSNVTRDGRRRENNYRNQPPPMESKWQTYWRSVKMMLIPMCIVLGILGVLYLLVMLLSGNLF